VVQARNSGVHGQAKSAAAFRTIAEVSGELELPAHVLRFWESKFPQIKPMKRRGGRRYYRPEDVAVLRQIRTLLYTEGYTIRGVQKLLREGGVVSSGAPPEVTDADAPRPFQDGSVAVASRSDLRAVLEELEAIRDLLKSRAGDPA
jgi:DNA-binding transcriptional MerR regulator